MDRRTYEPVPGILLDARRAVWLPGPRVLAIADLHLGYAWAHRTRGQLLPIAHGEDTLDRLATLAADYDPAEIVLLGDIVHEAVPIEPLADALRTLHTQFGTRLRAVTGNHDRNLLDTLRQNRIPITLLPSHTSGHHTFEHGDLSEDEAAQTRLSTLPGPLFIGHEHPVIALSDSAGSHLRAPCFLVGPRLIVLPAFSPWAAGNEIRARRFLSAYVRAEPFTHAITIIAGKLLPLPL
jgi:uncharacterized protein